jgi:dihydrofolate reductase
MIISLVVAVADNGVIGRDGGLPWRLSSDLKTFRRLTMGKPLVMGRRTFLSLKKPLDGRDNIIVTRDPEWRPAGAIVAGSWLAALAEARRCAQARGVAEIMVIGGTAVFADALASADRIYKTEVHGSPAGDAFFPAVDWTQWEEREREELPYDPRDDFTATLVVLERKGSPRKGRTTA